MQAKSFKLEDVYSKVCIDDNTKNVIEFLRIPEYQRSYCWKTDMVDDFLDSIDFTIDGKPAFFGSVLFVEPDEKGVVDVVDGQQRLITFSLLVRVILILAYKYELSYISDDDLGKLQRLFYKYDKDKKELYLKIISQESNKEFFSKILPIIPTNNMKDHFEEALKTIENWKNELDELDEKATNYIKQNGVIIFEKLEKKLENEDKKTYLENLAKNLLEKVEIVQICIKKDEDAQSIFDIMNAGFGMPLTVSDRIKNILIKKNSDDKYVFEKWTEEFEKLENDKNFWETDFKRTWHIRLFFDTYINFKRKDFISENADKEKKDDYIKTITNFTYEEAKNELSEILKCANIYKEFIKNEFIKDRPEYSFLIRTMHSLDTVSVLPHIFAYSLSDDFKNKDKELLFRNLASFIIFRSYTMNKVAKIQLEPTDWDWNKADFKNIGRYHSFANRFLQVLENGMRKEKNNNNPQGQDCFFDWNNALTLEHIYPQNKTKWNDNGDMKDLSDDEKSWLSNQIGNMLVLNKRTNSSLKNNIFSKKESTYYEDKKNGSLIGHMYTCSDLIDERFLVKGIWTKETIENRTKVITEKATEIFSYKLV